MLSKLKFCSRDVGISGQVAQLVEQRTENPRVGGSIPSLATTKQERTGDIAGPFYLMQITLSRPRVPDDFDKLLRTIGNNIRTTSADRLHVNEIGSDSKGAGTRFKEFRRSFQRNAPCRDHLDLRERPF